MNNYDIDKDTTHALSHLDGILTGQMPQGTFVSAEVSGIRDLATL